MLHWQVLWPSNYIIGENKQIQTHKFHLFHFGFFAFVRKWQSFDKFVLKCCKSQTIQSLENNGEYFSLVEESFDNLYTCLISPFFHFLQFAFFIIIQSSQFWKVLFCLGHVLHFSRGLLGSWSNSFGTIGLAQGMIKTYSKWNLQRFCCFWSKWVEVNTN